LGGGTGTEESCAYLIASPTDEDTAGAYEINPLAKNTVFVYKKRKVVAKWVNTEYDDGFINNVLRELH
jgi:hypothetical protein